MIGRHRDGSELKKNPKNGTEPSPRRTARTPAKAEAKASIKIKRLAARWRHRRPKDDILDRRP